MLDVYTHCVKQPLVSLDSHMTLSHVVLFGTSNQYPVYCLCEYKRLCFFWVVTLYTQSLHTASAWVVSQNVHHF